MPKGRDSINQFWLDVFQTSCGLQSGWPKNAEDDATPLSDYLLPKFQLSLNNPSLRPLKNSVEFLNLKKCYEKVQKRRDGVSVQRPMDCNIRMVATFDAAWSSRDIDVFVQRHPDSAKLCGDLTGKVKLDVKIGKTREDVVSFSVDLDSIYKSHYDTPVYKLSTVDPLRRNKFVLIVRLTSSELDRHQYFTSSTFLIRSRRSPKTISVNRLKETVAD